MIKSFNLAATPLLHFGTGKIAVLADVVKTFGSKVLIVTGGRSFSLSDQFQKLQEQCSANKISFSHYKVTTEPTPALVDEAVSASASFAPEVVVAIGGGSALDAGKAIAAMLPINRPVKDYLEGVGKSNHPGIKVPFIAVPTTAGTGSEAAKNAVLSEIGEQGFKKSLRHNNFIPNVAIIDPVLALSCPSTTTAASGMDAFTQLLESYLSNNANRVTDAMAYEGLQCVSNSLERAYRDGSNLDARVDMALSAYLSGVTLTSAGLGLVHGLAGAIGGYFAVPHGLICSSLMAAANKVTVRKLRTGRTNDKALQKYSAIGKMFAKSDDKPEAYYVDFLLSTIERMASDMDIARLKMMGINSNDFVKIVTAAENKNNPVTLTNEEMLEVLELAS